MSYHPYSYDVDDIADHLDMHDLTTAERARKRRRQRVSQEPRRERSRLRRPPRTEADQAFKCGHCKQFIGAPATGGRHRNHCPNCLYSRHVDDKRPGDRRSDCHALMRPAGIISRRNGEQMILHRCLGCGKEAPNRIAADDNPIALMKLPPVASPAPEVLIAIVDTDEQSA